MRGTARAAARRPRVGLVNGASRSVVEDRLVHVERLVEPAEAVASPDPLEDRPGQIGARYVRIREIGTRQGGADLRKVRLGRAGLSGADPSDAERTGADPTAASRKGIRGRDRLRGLDKALHVDQAIFND